MELPFRLSKYPAVFPCCPRLGWRSHVVREAQEQQEKSHKKVGALRRNTWSHLWTPTFREVWSIGSHNFCEHFEKFCESIDHAWTFQSLRPSTFKYKKGTFQRNCSKQPFSAHAFVWNWSQTKVHTNSIERRVCRSLSPIWVYDHDTWMWSYLVFGGQRSVT